MDTKEYVAKMTCDHIKQVHTYIRREIKNHSAHLSEDKKTEVKKLQNDIENVLDEGDETKYIQKSDKRAMGLSDKLGRLYGQSKVHKAIKEGEKPPPL